MRAAIGMAVLLGLLAGARGARAQVSVAEPKYHGILSVRRAAGSFDNRTATGSLRVPLWVADVSPDSNGIFPAQEPIELSMNILGSEETFTLAAGLVKASRSGRVFRYRAPRGSSPRGLQTFRFWLRRDGSYGIRLTAGGVDLSVLKNEYPICVALAVIIGDDDFFDGVNITRPSFTSRHLSIPGRCDVDPNAWTWING